MCANLMQSNCSYWKQQADSYGIEVGGFSDRRIKQRKGAVKSQAKFEPDVFRNSLYKFFEAIQPGDWDGYLSSLDKAGNTVCGSF